MYSFKGNISTFLFFLFSILISYFFAFSINPNQTNTSSIVEYENVNHLISKHEVLTNELKVLNPNYLIHYSLNGGDYYFTQSDKLELSDLDQNELQKYPIGLKWKSPYPKQPSIKSIRFYLENKNGKKTEEQIVTNMHGFRSKLPVISINCSEQALFGATDGMFMFGEDSWENEDFKTSWYELPGNFKKRGKKNEVSVNFQYVINDSCLFNHDLGMRISGNATRSFPQKSLRFEMLTNDIVEEFDFPFWDEGDKPDKWKSFVLRNSGNDNTRTLFADLIMQDLASEAKVITLKGHPTVVFINGTYWGIYNMRERVSQLLVANREDVDETEVTLLENGSAELKDGSETIRDSFVSTVEGYLSGTIDFNTIDDLISLKSFADYMFFETYYANQDWPDNNTIWFKAGDKKWQWILNDLDYSLAYPGKTNVNENMFNRVKNSNAICAKLFTKLITEKEFKKLFKKRSKKYLEESLNKKIVQEKFERYIKLYESEIDRHEKRWRAIGSHSSWEIFVKENLDFLENRESVYWEDLKEVLE